MGLETAPYVANLVSSNPVSGDFRKQGDDHLRLIKLALLQTFGRFQPKLTTAGTSTVLTLTTGHSGATYEDKGLYGFILHTAIGVDATLNVDGLGAKTLKVPHGTTLRNTLAGEYPSGAFIVAVYNAAAATFTILTTPYTWLSTAGGTVAALVVTGNLTAGTTGLASLSVTGAAAVGTTFDVTGAATFASTVSTGALTATTGLFNGAVTVRSTDGGATGRIFKLLHDSPSPAAADIPGIFDISFRSSIGGERVGGRIAVVIQDTTDGSEDADLILHNVVAGTITERIRARAAGTLMTGPVVTTSTLTTGGAIQPVSITNYSIGDDGSGNPTILLDSGDSQTFDRATNSMNHFIGSAFKWQWNATNINVGTTDGDVSDNIGTGNQGLNLWTAGIITVARDAGPPAFFNRLTDDGSIVVLSQDGNIEGSISVSGATVSYNAFAGAHWSQFERKPAEMPLLGTVMSTVDEMCEWRAVEFTIPASEGMAPVTFEDGKIGLERRTLPEQNKHILYDGPGEVGSVIDYEYRGATHRAMIVREENSRLPKCQISTLETDPAVYGVWNGLDEEGDASIMALGAFVCRVEKGTVLKRGYLLESAGNGCARVQRDNIVRSSTIGKVTSAQPQATYPDGSFLVPVVLMCG